MAFFCGENSQRGYFPGTQNPLKVVLAFILAYQSKQTFNL
jgi:hypothetical protein